MAEILSENSEQLQHQCFECNMCQYKCYKKQHFTQHLTTNKHKNMIGNNVANSGNDTEQNICACGKLYKDRTGLWKHKKKCKSTTLSTDKNTIIACESTNNDLITYLMNENKELKNMIMEMCKSHKL